MKKLTIVVGAGASCGYGLPTGHQLKTTIAQLLDVRYSGGQVTKETNWEMAQAMRFAAQADGVPHVDYQAAGWRIRDAMPQAISIDNFIDCQKDKGIEKMGKLAIAHGILQAERASDLFIDPRTGQSHFDFKTLADDWLGAFFQILTQGCGLAEVEARLRAITFVIFNYDRCIEHYLFGALQNYYGANALEAARVLESASFLHPYGTVGSLPWQAGEQKTSFGEEVSSKQLHGIAGQIKTFTEGTDEDASDICAIRDSIQTSERLLFLGFAYHRLNMDLLKPKDKAPLGPRRLCFGTAFGVSDFDTQEIKKDIRRMHQTEPDNVHLRPDLKCHQIFGEYSRGISID